MRQQVKKTLYINRPLLNSKNIVNWAKSQGFKSMLNPQDLHTTIAYSKQPLDWDQVGTHLPSVRVNAGNRSVEPLGDEGAVVLKFESPKLHARWQDVCDCGASWDYDNFSPHLTITYYGAPKDLKKVIPYNGPLIFGPEIFEEIKKNANEDLPELELTTQASFKLISSKGEEVLLEDEKGNMVIANIHDRISKKVIF